MHNLYEMSLRYAHERTLFAFPYLRECVTGTGFTNGLDCIRMNGWEALHSHKDTRVSGQRDECVWLCTLPSVSLDYRYISINMCVLMSVRGCMLFTV